jgi:hypothetical protein
VEGVRIADEGTTLITMNADGSLSQVRPLEGVTEKLESTTAARASGKATEALEGYANASKVKPFIGTKVDPNNLPEGYLYGKIPLEDGTFREVVYMPKPKNTTVPLVVKDGQIELGAKGQYRIVNDKVYLQNVETVPGKPGKLLGKDSQVHHLFADNLLRGTPFGQRTLELGAVNPDAAMNLIELANSLKNLDKAREAHPNVKFSDFVHNTQHPKFDKLMQEVVNEQIRAVRDAKGLSRMKEPDFIQQMTKEEIKAVWDESLARMRRGLMNEDGELYRKIKTRPNSGSLAQSEPLDNSEVA